MFIYFVIAYRVVRQCIRYKAVVYSWVLVRLGTLTLNPRSYTNRYLMKDFISKIKMLLLLNSPNTISRCLIYSSLVSNMITILLIKAVTKALYSLSSLSIQHQIYASKFRKPIKAILKHCYSRYKTTKKRFQYSLYTEN